MLKQYIFIRKDLNMRKGKMVSQGSHSIVGNILQSNISKEQNIIDIPFSDSIKDWLGLEMPIEIRYVEGKEELIKINQAAKGKGLLSKIIVDNGLTEFNGVKTHTTTGVGPCTKKEIDELLLSIQNIVVIEEVPIVESHSVESNSKDFEDMRTKQVLILRKDLKLSKEEIMEYGAKASLKVFFNNNENKENNGLLIHMNPEVEHWVRTCFTKITVSVKSEKELLELYEKALENNLFTSFVKDKEDKEFVSIAIGPARVERINPLTQDLSLL